MTTTEQIAAEVLAEHRDWDWDYLGRSGKAFCQCGVEIAATSQADDGPGDANYRAHVASVLAARLDDGLAAKVAGLADEWRDAFPDDTAAGVNVRAFAYQVKELLLDQPHTGTNP